MAMPQRLQIYRCETCGNIVMVMHAGPGPVWCCGKPMKLMTEKTEDQGKEKHVPVLQKTDKGYRVKVGSMPHPMMPEHYIEWIEVTAGDTVMVKFLSPEDMPEAEFETSKEPVKAREYCNVHGLWTSK